MRHGLSAEATPSIARKITPYGKYSYLAFQGKQNRDKGFWSIAQSPLEYRWSDDAKE